jgi:hypothetical protein
MFCIPFPNYHVCSRYGLVIDHPIQRVDGNNSLKVVQRYMLLYLDRPKELHF